MNGLVSLAIELGPLIAFYAANHYGGLRMGVAASVAVSAATALGYRVKKKPPTRFLKFSIAATLFFGALDLSLQTPVFFRYEAAITNVMTGLFFGMTLWGGKPLIQEFAEKRWEAKGERRELTPDGLYFFRFSTAVWTVYFFAKAAVYAWISSRYSIEKALALRAAIGNASLYALLFANIFLAAQIKALLARLRLSPSASGVAL